MNIVAPIMGASDDSVSSISGPASVPCLAVSLRPPCSLIYVPLSHMLVLQAILLLFTSYIASLSSQQSTGITTGHQSSIEVVSNPQFKCFLALMTSGKSWRVSKYNEY